LDKGAAKNGRVVRKQGRWKVEKPQKSIKQPKGITHLEFIGGQNDRFEAPFGTERPPALFKKQSRKFSIAKN